jgi:Fic family protein
MTEVSRAQGFLMGRLADVGTSLRDQISLAALTNDVVKTREIEGERLNVESLRSSIARRLKAGLAHLWFVTFHPFDDGNGRIARAIGDLLLAPADGGRQRFYSFSAQIQRERKAYYDIVEGCPVGETKVDAAVLVIGALTGAGRLRHAQRDRGEPFAVLANNGQIVGRGLCPETMLPAGANHHRAPLAAPRRSVAPRGPC